MVKTPLRHNAVDALGSYSLFSTRTGVHKGTQFLTASSNLKMPWFTHRKSILFLSMSLCCGKQRCSCLGSHAWHLLRSFVKQDACQNDRGIENTLGFPPPFGFKIDYWEVWHFFPSQILNAMIMPTAFPDLLRKLVKIGIPDPTLKPAQIMPEWRLWVSLTSGMSPLNPLLLGLGVSRKPDISMSILQRTRSRANVCVCVISDKSH